MEPNITCMICGQHKDSYRKLSKHYRDAHKLSSKEYYDSYLKTSNEGICVFCSSETTFVSLTAGYLESCGSCRSVRMKLTREKNKNDPEKYKSFISKVKTNQSRIWKERENNGSAVHIRKKIGNTIKNNNLNLSDEERKKKFGWLNGLSDADKQTYIKTVLLNTGCHLWWKTATQEEKELVFKKRTEKKLNYDNSLIQYYYDNRHNLQLYNTIVDYFTNITYFKYRELIDPDHLRGKGHHLDHKYSKFMGFVNQVDPKIIASLDNLEILPEKENMSKGAKCSIDLSYLIERYRNE